MFRFAGHAFFVALVFQPLAHAKFFSVQDSLRSVSSAKTITVDDLQVRLQKGWLMKQSAQDGKVKLLGFAKDEQRVDFYVRPAGGFDARAVFATNVDLLEEFSDSVGSLQWNLMSTHKAAAPETTEVFVTAFSKEFNGKVYYGYASAQTLDQTKRTVGEFLSQISVPMTDSLTGPDYTGKKYYLGFGRAMSMDPSQMHNEVKYDVLHTHDIFTKEVGGSYIGTKLISGSASSGTAIRAKWAEIGAAMNSNDMFVQYSSGHGSGSGLEVGLTYNEIRDNALSYPAQEIIVLTMACYSGNMVNGFNAKKSVWENWQAQGRTLFVMASSMASETSSTGPGTDPDEPGGPYGSSGSAFGWALWKSLIGYADGYVDGVKDGYLNLEEIQKYTIAKTKYEGGHTPVVTGAFDPKLKMNKVPPKEWLQSLEHSTENLSDAEIQRQIQALDAEMRLGS